MAPIHSFHFYTSIPPCPHRTTLGRGEEEDTLSPSAENTSNLVKAVCQNLISDIWKELHAKLKSLRGEIAEHRSNTTNVTENTSACLDSMESSIPFATVAGKTVLLHNDVNIILEEPKAPSNEMDPRFSRAAERLAPLEQENKPDTAHILGPKERLSADQEGWLFIKSRFSFPTFSSISRATERA